MVKDGWWRIGKMVGDWTDDGGWDISWWRIGRVVENGADDGG